MEMIGELVIEQQNVDLNYTIERYIKSDLKTTIDGRGLKYFGSGGYELKGVLELENGVESFRTQNKDVTEVEINEIKNMLSLDTYLNWRDKYTSSKEVFEKVTKGNLKTIANKLGTNRSQSNLIDIDHEKS